MNSATNPPIALVLGANGRLGAAAVQAFAAAGWRVLAQARRAPAALPAGAVHLALDVAASAGLAAAAAGARVVVHGLNPPYTRWQTDALPLMRQGLAVAHRLGATFMLPGNVYNFGAQMPPLLDEHTPQRPTTRKGHIRLQMETELHAAAQRGQRCIVIRAGDFFGAGTGSWMDLVIAKSLRGGKLVYPGPLDVAHAWAYLPDLARAFVAAAECDTLPAYADLPFAGHTVTGAQWLDAIEHAAASLGVVPARGFRRGKLPWGVLRLAGLVLPMWREVAEMSYLWHVPHALDGAALARAVHLPPATPLDSAVREALVLLLAHAKQRDRHHGHAQQLKRA
jgi:nucleoside-diphosphate-sugar epimerase